MGRRMMRAFAAGLAMAIAGAAATVSPTAAAAQSDAVPDPVPGEVAIGMITTLSGPGSSLGIDVRDAFALAVEEMGGKLGGLDARVIEGDDQQKPDVAKQLADRMVERDGVRFVTGVIWSNLALALMPSLERSEVFFVSANAGPSQLAGRQCSPFFFSASYQNDGQHEATGQYVRDQGFERVYLMAPNYPAGKDSLAGFKRFYGGGIAGEVYTTVGQLDYAAEIAQLRAADPDAVFVFYPGGMGINFVKQYDQAGLKGDIPLFGPGFTFAQDVLPAMGEAAVGAFNGAQWSPDLDTAANRAFVAAFEERYGRLPSVYAAQAYNAARLIDGAIRRTGGDLEDEDALREALMAADFEPVTGNFEFNTNHFPIQDYYIREVVKDEQGRITNRVRAKVFTDHEDAYHTECKM